MKIGAVCEQTGLTDRTVRFYTEEGLLSPGYTKNYLGRKSFDFSEEDVAMLKDIAVLRKYGFSIPEIKTILEDPAKSVEIIEALRLKKKDTIQSEQELLDALLALEQGRAYTVPELAEALNTPKLAKQKLPDDDNDSCLTAFCTILFWWLTGPMALFTIFFLPISLVGETNTFLYAKPLPNFTDVIWGMFGMLIPVVAAVAMIVLHTRRGYMDSAIRQLLTITLTICYLLFGLPLYVVSLVMGIMSPGVYSETEDPSHYMELGTYEREIMGEKLELLFPDDIPSHALGAEGIPCPDTTRYYNYVENSLGGRFELFAQWELTEEELASEKERIRMELSGYEVTESTVGQWTIWNFSWSDAGMCLQYPDIYEDAVDYYSYLFFAYNTETGMVRYVSSFTDYADSLPAFCSLDWN